MKLLKFWIVFLLFLYGTNEINGATHWVVTENGKIESNLDSPFNIRRPYDLLALLEQEQRLEEINTLYKELIAHKKNIDQKLFKMKDISKISSRLDDYDCLNKGRNLNNINFYSSLTIEDNGETGLEFQLKESPDEIIENYKEPHCENFSVLELGKIQFDSLESIKNYENLSLVPDPNLEQFLTVSSVKYLGHEVAVALEKNSTSWLHYNLASLFWRMNNVGSKAIQCSRRAIYFVTERYKDIALHMLAGILHQSRKYEDAAQLLLVAVGLAPNQPSHLLGLGNIYASLAEYNKSIYYYDKYLEVKPDQDVIANKHAALCFWKLENDLWKLENEVVDIHKFFKGILADLQIYHERQMYWLKLQERSLWEEASFKKQLITLKTQGLLVDNFNRRCFQEMVDDPNKFVACDLTNNLEQFDMQQLFNFIESKTQQINNYLAKEKEAAEMFRMKPKEEIDKKEEHEPSYFDYLNWPDKKECQKWNLPLNEREDLDLPVFLSLDDKGYRVKEILSTLIGIPDGEEHPLPWRPPVCNDWDSASHRLIPTFEKASGELKSNEHLRHVLLSTVNNGKAVEAEIGQRIVTAMQKKVAPSWALATLASLYWRVRGSRTKSLDCLDFALKNVEKDEPNEAVLVSIASVAHELGYADDALKFALQAFHRNDRDPSTNFLLALIHYKKDEELLALHYIKNAMRIDKDYYEGRAEKLLKIWSCRMKITTLDVTSAGKMDKTCTLSSSGVEEGVVCSLKGENCRTASVQCFRRDTTETKKANKIDQDCSKDPINDYAKSLLSDDFISTDPDHLVEGSVQAFHMKISLGDNLAPIVALMDDPIPEVLVQFYEKSGTLLLSPQRCRQIQEAEWVYFTSMWQSIATRNIDIGAYLKPLPKSLKNDVKPYCSRSIPSSPATMDHLTAMILKNRLPNSPEKALLEWLSLMAGDQKASLKDLGAKIGIALNANSTSWVLANAAGLFWRIVGNTEEAVICLRQALTYVQDGMRDVPLISLANVLNRVGFHTDALEAAYAAVKSHPNYVFNHFTAGNIHTAMGDYEKAISFYRASLALDANFAPARNRLLAISCMFLYDESGTLREPED